MMKNTIPLILAVACGLAAVFGVSRFIAARTAESEKNFVDVVAAARDIIAKDGEIKESWLMKKHVEISSLPAKAIPWSQANSVLGQTVTRMVARRDYILTSDISGVEVRLANAVPAGEWAIPVTFANGKIVKFLNPGDEIVILGAGSSEQTLSSRDKSQKPQTVEQDVMSVIFPCVRVLDIGKGDGVRRAEDYGGDTIIVSLSPRKAMALLAAQRKMKLYVALRKPNDGNAMRRRDVGVVDDKTFLDLRQNLESVVLPDGSDKQ